MNIQTGQRNALRILSKIAYSRALLRSLDCFVLVLSMLRHVVYIQGLPHCLQEIKDNESLRKAGNRIQSPRQVS